MARKRLTQIFPFLIPFRTKQKVFFFHLKLFFDKNKYATSFSDELPYMISEAKTWLINEDSGMDIKYQYNKVDNLKLTSKTVNLLLIKPGEVFSFCKMAEYVKRNGKYKDGLVINDGILTITKGGGICQVSNLLYYLFLMTPLTIIERHGHAKRALPNPDKGALEGIDATVYDGWLDLKVKNNTNNTYQIKLWFDNDYMYGNILSDKKGSSKYEIINQDFKYFKRDNKIYESVAVVKNIIDNKTNKKIKEEKLYDEVVEITYQLPDSIEIEEIN